jgi:hypothetical protein
MEIRKQSPFQKLRKQHPVALSTDPSSNFRSPVPSGGLTGHGERKEGTSVAERRSFEKRFRQYSPAGRAPQQQDLLPADEDGKLEAERPREEQKQDVLLVGQCTHEEVWAQQ